MKQLLFCLLLITLVIGNSEVSSQQPTPNDYQIVFLSERQGKLDVYSMNIDGTNVQPLVYSDSYVSTVSCSPDGEFLLTDSANSGIWVTELDTLNSSSILTGQSDYYQDPAWSPDGSKIAFNLRTAGYSDIYIANADGTNLTRLTNSPSVDRLPAWSPDGSKIVFASERDNAPGIFVINADGTNEQRLTSNQLVDTTPVWSPDGTKIMFTSFSTQVADIFTINPDGTGRTRLIGSGETNNWRGSWSPDGSKIMFTSSRDGNPEIYIMDSNGSNLLRLTNDPSLDLSGCWLLNPAIVSDGTGLRGQYFDALNFATLKFFRIVPTIDFNWGTGSPATGAIAVDTFSIRWTGQVQPLYSETYTFYSTHNDGARLWVDGQQLINDWVNHASAVEQSGTISLTAGVKYDIVLEYYENTGSASVKLEWSSPSQTRQVIPASQLYPPEGQLAFTGRTSGNDEWSTPAKIE